jgi:hypothetical protein
VASGDAERFEPLVKELGFERFCIQLCHWICFFRCHRFCICVCPDPFDNPLFTSVGDFDIYADIDTTTGRTNKDSGGHGGPDFGFFGCLHLGGFCPKTSPTVAGEPMRYRFLYESPPATTHAIVGSFVCRVVVGYRLIPWQTFATGFLQLTQQKVVIQGAGATPDPTPPPAPLGTAWGGPPEHVIVPDADGWVPVDQAALDSGFMGPLLGFSTPGAFADGAPAPATAGQEVAVGDQRNGRTIAIIFEATRISTPDFTNRLDTIQINNWGEVNELNLLQFHTTGGTPCSPLSTDLDIEYTVDHELIRDFSVTMSSASGVAFPPLPPISNPPADNVTARGGFGTHHEDIAAWPSCSYTVTLHTRRRLTDGINDDPTKDNSRTFCK